MHIARYYSSMKTDAALPPVTPAAHIAQLEAELARLRVPAETTEQSPSLILRLAADGQPEYQNAAAQTFIQGLDKATAHIGPASSTITCATATGRRAGRARARSPAPTCPGCWPPTASGPASSTRARTRPCSMPSTR